MRSNSGKIALMVFSRVAAIIALVAGILVAVANLPQIFGLPHFLSDLQLIAWAVTVSIGVGVVALIVILARYAGAALRRIRVGEDDSYFIVAFLLGIFTFLIGHHWK
jgi:hypothetical protein